MLCFVHICTPNTFTWCTLEQVSCEDLHWNPSNPDTNGTEESVHIREVYLLITWGVQPLYSELVYLVEWTSVEGKLV